MNFNFKKLAVALLATAMASSMMTGIFADEAPATLTAEAIPVESITVDGVKDAAWDDATEYTMEGEVWGDSRGDEATKKDSSTVKFRLAYSATKVYMLVEVEDDVWQNAKVGTNWRNDSLMIFISEDGTDRSQTSDKSTCMVAFLANKDDANADKTGFFVRSGKGANDKTKEHAVVIDGNKAVMELSFEFNTITPDEGGSFVMDLQYNDQDLDPTTAAEQSRTIVWSWSTNKEFGPNSNSGDWGTVNFVSAPECEHAETELKNAKEATATEDGYTGDKVCKECGETVEKGKTIPATGTQGGEVKPAPTGDATLAVSVLALAAVAGAVVISRRRKV